jgi:parallel beta-helix repeat protein
VRLANFEGAVTITIETLQSLPRRIEMKNGFLTYLVAKNRRNKLKWRVPTAMLAGIALLFPFQGFSQAEENHKAMAIHDCSTPINTAGRYFLLKDLKQCSGISITVSDVEIELRGHTIQGSPSNALGLIDANGVTTGLSNIEIEGPGTLAGGGFGILFQNVHRSRVNNVVVAGNIFGIVVAGTMMGTGNTLRTVLRAADLRSLKTMAGTTSTDNEFRDNVVAGQLVHGVLVAGSNQNRFIHNNLSGNGGEGLLISGNKNIARHNTVDSNVSLGIDVDASSSGNIFDDNIALGNSTDLVDETVDPDCANKWTDNSFNFINSISPGCIK